VLENQIDADRLGDRVVLLGHLSRPDVISLVKACDVFVMPSRTEGTPIALLEAAALRKPILATRVGGIPELVKDGEECLLVNVDAPQEIANGIQYIIQDTEFADMIAENAYQRIIDSFSLSSQTQLTIQSYQAALNN
ncbi:MAG TPA: group 1 glycosyl transferase, partial [Flavobacteriales bacterium]|nr:group 1 glycosyl transferase [Flavobacteriales bacterium]